MSDPRQVKLFPRWPLHPGDRYVNVKGWLLGTLIVTVLAWIARLVGLV